MKILVSAGHYPEKPGACYEGFCEHDEALLWVRQILMGLGNIGEFVPVGTLSEKVDFINRSSPSLAVEVHFNSAVDINGNHIGRGCETLFCPGSRPGEYVAEHIQELLAPVMGKNRGIREGYYRMNPQNPPDYFLQKTICPAVILEPEFIHRMDNIRSKRVEACGAIASAIINVMRGDV